ncbi:MAG: leucyl/phenylalanyl-tRNA--protein transferase [Thermodesulfobacteriota bacterium]
MPVFRLTRTLAFPPPGLADPDGLLAVGGDLTPDRLLLAYQQGIFPWYGPGDPILWWSPDPRFVLLPEAVHIPRRLARTLRQGRFTLTIDTAFAQVIAACATVPRPGQPGTWIVPAMAAAYNELFRLGFAHSVEAWQDDTLAGGLYGVSLGRAFFGESMFHHVADASSAALVFLCQQLTAWGFDLLDCQVATGHLSRLGARPMPRPEFLARLAKSIAAPTRPGPWTAPAGASPPGSPPGSPSRHPDV